MNKAKKIQNKTKQNKNMTIDLKQLKYVLKPSFHFFKRYYKEFQ